MDTSTTYLGLKLAHPFIAGASPMGYRLDTIRRLEDAGCAAIVLHSLFEEQISPTDSRAITEREAVSSHFPSGVAEFPDREAYHHNPDRYAEHVRTVKAAVGSPAHAISSGIA